MALNIIKVSERGAAGALLLVTLAACGGVDATTLQPTTGVEPASPAPPEMLIQDETPADPVTPVAPAEVVQSEHVKTVPQADGSFASEIDATNMQSWVYFSLQSRQEVAPAAPEQSPSWDLGFQRSNVKVNGGTSGTGDVTVSVASGAFESVDSPPADGYVADTADADQDGSPDYAFAAGDGWYSYDPASHTLTARPTVFVVKTPGGYFKLQFSGYYDAAGTPGRPQFRWAPLGGS